MAYTDLGGPSMEVFTGKESVVIKLNLESLEGGRSLNVTGFNPSTIKAGHIVIRETATGELKPMPLAGGDAAYAALPAGHTYYGVVISTQPKDKPMVGILLRGTVNPNACPYPMGGILAAVTTALSPSIMFRAD